MDLYMSMYLGTEVVDLEYVCLFKPFEAPCKCHKLCCVFWKQRHSRRSLETHRPVGKIGMHFFLHL